MDSCILQKLRLLAPLLDQLCPNPEAECYYDSFSGGLLWADEVPNLLVVPPGTFEALRGVLWYRTALILGEAKNRDKPLWTVMEQTFPGWSGEASANENEALWNEAQKLFPNWPGFAPSRRSMELKEKCMDLKAKATEEIDKLFDS